MVCTGMPFQNSRGKRDLGVEQWTRSGPRFGSLDTGLLSPKTGLVICRHIAARVGRGARGR